MAQFYCKIFANLPLTYLVKRKIYLRGEIKIVPCLNKDKKMIVNFLKIQNAQWRHFTMQALEKVVR